MASTPGEKDTFSNQIKPHAMGRNFAGRQIPTFLDVTCRVRLHTVLHVVACCWELLGVVAQRLKPVRLFSQQLPTFLLFCDPRSAGQQCYIRLQSSTNIVGATHALYARLTKSMGCFRPTMHTTPNIVGSFYVRLHVAQ